MREGEALRDGAACGAQAYDRRRAGHARADDASGAVDEDAVVAGLSASNGGADAVTGATWAEPQGGVARGESFCERDEAGSSFDADVQEVIDAVTGGRYLGYAQPHHGRHVSQASRSRRVERSHLRASGRGFVRSASCVEVLSEARHPALRCCRKRVALR